jgi:energy-coupling factor transporter ATP-binding protein EcfA2
VRVLSLEGLHFRYRSAQKPILDRLELSIEAGQGIIISGPSGGGKTTLCLISCTIIPTRLAGEFTGHAELMGENTLKLGPQGAAGYVGYVMQEPEYSMVMPTVEEEMAFGLENRSWPADEIRLRVEELMESFELRGISGRAPQRLSGGEKQIGAIAAAIAHRPKLLVLDEAFSALDDEKRWLADEEIARLKRAGSAILLVEHDGIGRDAHRWADRHLRLIDGALQEVAS